MLIFERTKLNSEVNELNDKSVKIAGKTYSLLEVLTAPVHGTSSPWSNPAQSKNNLICNIVF